MYGTVARMKVKPGMMDQLREMSMTPEMMSIPGLIQTYVYVMDADPNTLMMAVVFSDKEAYLKNAGSSEQNERYEQMVALLEGTPEWNDGEIVYPAT